MEREKRNKKRDFFNFSFSFLRERGRGRAFCMLCAERGREGRREKTDYVCQQLRVRVQTER